jgi:prolyl-tRNA synthetase
LDRQGSIDLTNPTPAVTASSAAGQAWAMPSTRWSQTLIPTQKNDPAEATLASHKLLVRGGFIRQLQAGVYDFLPLGWRCLYKTMQIVREEMNRAGAAECFLPVLQPIEIWEKSGRNAIYGPDMLRAVDRHERANALAPTHEECITEAIAAYVSSYKQLPLTLYQIQTKFRDEPRPRSGLLRVREFIMKDAYSFDTSEEGLDTSYWNMFRAYERIYARCGIPALPVEAESGPIGGSASHEFTVPCDAGEDIILTSDKGNYAANVEKAETGERKWSFEGEPTGKLEEVHTPNLPGIDEVGKFLKVKPKNMLKTLIFKRVDGNGFVIAVVRGDHEVNLAKLRQASGLDLELDEQAARAGGFFVGYVGPHVAAERKDVRLVVDPDAAQSGFWATGANKPDYHVKHFSWTRDLGERHVSRASESYFQATSSPPSTWEDPGARAQAVKDSLREVLVADIRNAVAGDPSPKNDGGVLRESRGVEVGHVFKLGTRYSPAFGANFLDENNQSHPVIMGCYGIGVGRIVLSAVEVGHDERGIIWPASIAPYSVVITPIKYEAEMRSAADALFAELSAAGVDVLLDDRDDRPGSKFADADLIGIPVRITVGDRGLKEGLVEVKVRKTGEVANIPLAGAADRVREILDTLIPGKQV